MRKTLLLVLTVLLLFGVWGSAMSAVEDPTTGVPSLAQYFPADTVVYAAIRVDEGYLDQLDVLSRQLSAPFAELGIPSLGLRDTLSLALGTNPATLDDVLAFLGDNAAFGITAVDRTGNILPEGLYAAIELDDRAAAQRFLEGELGTEPVVNADGMARFDHPMGNLIDVYDDLMVISVVDIALPADLENSLAQNADYQRGLENLVEPSYNILVWAQTAPFLALQDASLPEGLSFNLQPQMVGFTIIDETNLVIDTALLPDVEGPRGDIPQVAFDFARYLPEDTSAVILAADLSGLYTSSTNTLRTAIEADGGPDPIPQVEAVLSTVGIDLQADLLDWATGNYAVFARIDTAAILRAGLNYEIALAENVDFGVVIESADNAGAPLAEKLGALLSLFQGTEGVTISTETLGGVDVHVVSVDLPVPNVLTADAIGADEDFNVQRFELLLGATDEVFFLSTRGPVEALFDGGSTLADMPIYSESLRHSLPQPMSYWWTDADGFVGGTVANPIVVLTLLGPQIGTIFDNIIGSLGGATPTPSPTPTPTATPDPAVIDQQVGLYEAVLGNVRSSSASATITEDGVSLIRLVLSYNVLP